MDTKLKNNEQSTRTKKTTYLLLTLSLIFLSIATLGFSSISTIKEVYFQNFSENTANATINYESVRYVKNLNRFYVYFRDFNSNEAYLKLKELEEKININNLEIEEFTSEYSMNSETETNLNKHPNSYYNNITIEKMTNDEILVAYSNLKEIYENYNSVKNYLKNTKSFQYKITNNKTKETFTNNENIEKEEFHYKFNLDDQIFSEERFNGEILSSNFEQNHLNGFIIIPKNIGDYKDSVVDNIETINFFKIVDSYLKIITPISFVISLFIIGCLIFFKKQNSISCLKNIYLKFRKLPLSLKLILFIVSYSFFNECGNIITECSYSTNEYSSTTLMFQDSLMLILCFIFSVLFISTFLGNIAFVINIIKNPQILKNEKEVKLGINIIKNVNIIFETKNYMLSFIYIIFILCTIISFILFGIVLFYINLIPFHILIGICLLEFLGLSFVYIILDLISKYCKLSLYISKMATENFEYFKSIETTSDFEKKPFSDLKLINNEINKKIEEFTKNERLKTELITNVSHDLKTPLTSIINYIDLLKEEEIKNKTAEEYIEILDNKSERLKILIEDLFEASKLSAKQYKLNIIKSDIISLLKQTIGELNDKIEDSDINFVLELPNKPIFLNIDGQQIWRVFDNLLNNILKYSPKNSRAYISVDETEEEVKIVMKNISKNPLNFDANELFERFKRGDVSRTSEGSGLGLSIAKSIIELHNGKILINIDGDLFKIAIIFNKKL